MTTPRTSALERRTALRRQLFEQLERGELDLPATIRMMRKVAGRTQIEYAKLVGVSPRILIELERGQGIPTVRTLQKMLAYEDADRRHHGADAFVAGRKKSKW